MRAVIVAAALALACASPARFTDAPMRDAGPHTEYAVTEEPGGFRVTVRYGRYQFIPESDAVALACRQQLTALAHEHAEKEGREIAPIDPQRIQVSLGRNGLTGITSCAATAPARWADDPPATGTP